jgi:hypothetical protein
VKKFFKIVSGLAIVLASVFLFLLWNAMGYWPIPKMHGLIDAHVDLAHGKFKEVASESFELPQHSP